MRQKKHLHFLCLLGLSLASCTRESCQTPPSEPVAVKNAPSTATVKDQNEKPATDKVDQAHPKKPGSETNKDEKAKKPEDKPTKESHKSTDASKKPAPKEPTKGGAESAKDKLEEKKATPSDEKKQSNSKSQPQTSSDTKK